MSTVPLSSDLGIEAASELKQQLAQHIDQPHLLHLDAGPVLRVHTASVQVLHAFFIEREQAGHRTMFINSSPAFIDAVRLLGLSAPLGLFSTNTDNLNPVENRA